jgi:nucleotide-binding universal stress UspA family protein
MAEIAAVVVGVDGSEGSRAAVRWSAQEAHRRQLPLRIVAAAGLDAVMPAHASESFWRHLSSYQESWANDLANDAADLARQITASVEPQTAVYLREPAVIALQRESESAGLLVVGSQGRGGAIGSRLGSTAIALTQQASGPVVVVPTAFGGQIEAEETEVNVVVGVDGSQTSQRAVEFAFAEAAMRNSGVTAVHAWTLPWLRSTLSVRHEVVTVTRPALQQEAAAVLSESLAEIRQKHPDVSVIEQVVEARPAEALVDASQNAPLLVVGSRGRGGVTGLLLGSVSHAVLHRAHCPVAVLRAPRQESPTGPLD